MQLLWCLLGGRSPKVETIVRIQESPKVTDRSIETRGPSSLISRSSFHNKQFQVAITPQGAVRPRTPWLRQDSKAKSAREACLARPDETRMYRLRHGIWEGSEHSDGGEKCYQGLGSCASEFFQRSSANPLSPAAATQQTRLQADLSYQPLLWCNEDRKVHSATRTTVPFMENLVERIPSTARRMTALINILPLTEQLTERRSS